MGEGTAVSQYSNRHTQSNTQVNYSSGPAWSGASKLDRGVGEGADGRGIWGGGGGEVCVWSGKFPPICVALCVCVCVCVCLCVCVCVSVCLSVCILREN